MGKKKVETIDASVANKLVEELFAEIKSVARKKLTDFKTGERILALNDQSQTRVLEATLEQRLQWDRDAAEFLEVLNSKQSSGAKYSWNDLKRRKDILRLTLETLLLQKLPIEESFLIRLMKWPAEDPDGVSPDLHCLGAIATAAETFAAANDLSMPVRAMIKKLASRIPRDNSDHHYRKAGERFDALTLNMPQIWIESGEAWSDAAIRDLEKMKAKTRADWEKLLLHCKSGGAKKLTDGWRKQAEQIIIGIGIDSFKDLAVKWFPLVDKPRTMPFERSPYEDQLIIPPHVELLRGLVWCCGLREDADLARAIAKLALSAYRKIPGKGPRLVSLGNACITSLGMMPGLPAIGQLAILKVKVKFGTAQKEIEKAFNAAAEREKLPRDEIEEMAVPSYGLEEVGVLREKFGDYQAELLVDGSSAALHWSKDGKPIKSVPAAVKKEHPEEFKELQASLKDINAMLPAQRERIDSLFLAQKSWPIDTWRERYLDHPLIGTIARRLIWTFTAKGKTHEGIWHDGKLFGSDDKPLAIKDDVAVSLWHPIGHTTNDILAWRNWLERHEVVQPFKQAHREVYILTDAERRTRSYSNRFAAHVLKQHQFNALCAARGWKNKLRLMVDDTYPPAHRALPQWNLRAEYWIEGAGSQYGVDTNETGTFLHLATDQVRFYRTDAAQLQAHAGGGGYGRHNQEVDEPLPLDQIPPLVFSEIMRDVDLFVGVASVGNDPNWNDGGPQGAYRDYWQSYSFGELSATAQTRKALLERLIPRLKIADRCKLEDRFLVVKGNIRTYKIHLGSGNILVLPNDQYLCIVPKQTVASHERVFLPFEGDGTLSIILSKAFLLAEDDAIKDPTIVSQLKK